MHVAWLRLVTCYRHLVSAHRLIGETRRPFDPRAPTRSRARGYRPRGLACGRRPPEPSEACARPFPPWTTMRSVLSAQSTCLRTHRGEPLRWSLWTISCCASKVHLIWRVAARASGMCGPSAAILAKTANRCGSQKSETAAGAWCLLCRWAWWCSGWLCWRLPTSCQKLQERATMSSPHLAYQQTTRRATARPL